MTNSTTSLIAKNLRFQNWADEVRDCKARPVGMTVNDWCKARGITKAAYYWHMHRLREECIKNSMPSAPVDPIEPTFVELQTPQPIKPAELPIKVEEPSAQPHGGNISARIHFGGAIADIYDTAPETLIRSLLEVMVRVK